MSAKEIEPSLCIAEGKGDATTKFFRTRVVDCGTEFAVGICFQVVRKRTVFENDPGIGNGVSYISGRHSHFYLIDKPHKYVLKFLPIRHTICSIEYGDGIFPLGKLTAWYGYVARAFSDNVFPNDRDGDGWVSRFRSIGKRQAISQFHIPCISGVVLDFYAQVKCFIRHIVLQSIERDGRIRYDTGCFIAGRLYAYDNLLVSRVASIACACAKRTRIE